LGPALAGGSVRLLTGARITEIELDGTGRVARLHGDLHGEPLVVDGSAFVLSAGAANSAAIMLASRNVDQPEGVANSTGLVGRNYMVHNNTHIAAVDPRRVNDVVFQKTLAVNDFYDDLGDGIPGGTIQFIGKVQGSMMKTHATRVPRVVLDRMAHRSLELLVMSEDTPSVHNRVTVSDDGRIHVSWRRTNYDRHEALLARAKKVLRKAGFTGVFEQRFTIDMNSHMCGTAKAGTDSATSVLDPLCRAHDVRNLWVVDSAFFPSSGAQNPALTIAAQALRVAAETEWGNV